MHILFLTDNFPPEGNAPASRTYEHAKEWINLGHQVTVITTAPNFPEGVIFPGYKNAWKTRENIDGIDVIRVKTYIAANVGFAKRILDYMSFMVTGSLAGLLVKRPDLVVATSPQFFTAVAGWFVSGMKRKPFIFELRDIWPASITAVGAMQDSKLIAMLERLEMFLYKRADRIVSLTHAFKDELVTRGVDKDKIDIVLNGVDLSRYSPRPKSHELVEKYALQNKFVVGYIGTHGMAHGLDSILKCAELLQNDERIHFLFAGGGAGLQGIKEMASEMALPNVSILGRQEKERMPDFWSLCDVSLVHLKDTKLFKSVIPSKIFESMGMGLPMIIAVPEGEATDIIASTQSGIKVEPENPKKLADAIVQLAGNPSEKKRLAENAAMAAARYERKTLAGKMLNVFESVVSRSSK